MSGCAEAVFDKLSKSMGLALSQEQRLEIMALIAAKSRMDTKGRRGESEAAKAECKRVQAAADVLLAAVSDEHSTIIDWADAIRTQSIVVSFADHSGPILGSQLAPDAWQVNVSRLLRCIAEVSKARARDLDENTHPGGRVPDKHAAMFAQTLFCHFIRAGGKTKDGTRGGFSAFLRLIWELLPLDGRQGNANTFARRHNDAVVRQHAENRNAMLQHGVDIGPIGDRFCRSQAVYAIELTKGYWGLNQ